MTTIVPVPERCQGRLNSRGLMRRGARELLCGSNKLRLLLAELERMPRLSSAADGVLSEMVDLFLADIGRKLIPSVEF